VEGHTAVSALAASFTQRDALGVVFILVACGLGYLVWRLGGRQ
jgi:hypothetical protein